MDTGQLTLPLASDLWGRVWKRRLLAARGATWRCGPLDVCARAWPGAIELEVRCARCGWSEGTAGCVDEWNMGAELLQAEVRDLLPGPAQDDHLGVRSDLFCQPPPDWAEALGALWRTAFEAAMEGASPEAIAACRPLHAEVRAACHYAIEADPSGRVLQLVQAQPVAAAVVAWAAARGERRRAWEPVLEGRPLREVLWHSARSLGRDRPEHLRRLRWLVRKLPAGASPRQVMSAIWLPLVHTDLPATAEDRRLWLTAMASAADALASVSDLEIRDCLSRYVSKHFDFMILAFGDDIKWSDLVDWMVATGRRPSRARDPQDLWTKVLVRVTELASARALQEAMANIEALERTGADLLPAPPWPAFQDGDFEVRPLVRMRDLLVEAQEMNHCLHHCRDHLRGGSCAAYSVRAGAHRATLMIARGSEGGWDIRELAGRSNRPPAPSLKARVERWAGYPPREERPLLFVDIDGVLAPFHGEVDLEPRCVRCLNDLVKRSKGRVVITSTWRERAPVHQMHRALAWAGFSAEISGVTPLLPGRPRADEIRAYLTDQPAGRGLAAPPFVILDDDPYMPGLEQRLVLIDPETGMGPKDVQSALRVLGLAEQDDPRGSPDGGADSPEASSNDRDEAP